jgi:acetyl-CoA acetyltransferase family protein
LFKDLTANELGALAARGALERVGVDPGEVDHVVFGNALQTGRDAIYGARHVALRAGIPQEVPALTVNRLCGSGIQSVISSAHLLLTGEARIVLAGGMENMSQSPHVIWGARSGFRLGEGRLEDLLLVALKDALCDLYMAETAEELAQRAGIPREEQDRFALESQRRAAQAREKGYLSEEIVPVKVRVGRQEVTVLEDDHMRPETTLEGLAKLPPAFRRDGQVTAGNASGIVDGAAAVVVTLLEEAERRHWEPLAVIRAWHVVGVEPRYMGIGPVPAIRGLLEKAGLQLGDVDLFEINEAFAAQYLAVERELELDRNRVNVNGGAIAIGHPLAATGTRLLLTLGREMRRRGARYGVASACIGGGQGIAMLLENPRVG